MEKESHCCSLCLVHDVSAERIHALITTPQHTSPAASAFLAGLSGEGLIAGLRTPGTRAGERGTRPGLMESYCPMHTVPVHLLHKGSPIVLSVMCVPAGNLALGEAKEPPFDCIAGKCCNEHT